MIKDNEIRGQIVEAASKYFSRYGFHKTTMDEIARHIHKAKGLLYYYFKNKESLFAETLKQELEAVKNELNRLVDEKSDPISMIETYFISRLKLLNEAVNYHEALKADFFERYHFVKDIRADFVKFEHDKISEILEKGQQECIFQFKEKEKAVNIIVMLMYAIEIPLYLQNQYLEHESTIIDLTSFIMNALKNTKK